MAQLPLLGNGNSRCESLNKAPICFVTSVLLSVLQQLALTLASF